MPDERADSPAVEVPSGPVPDGTPAAASRGEAQIAAGSGVPEAPDGTPDGAPEIPVVEEPQPAEEPAEEPGAGDHDYAKRWKDTKSDRDRLAARMHALQERGLVDDDGNPVETPTVEPRPERPAQPSDGRLDLDAILRPKSREFWDNTLDDIRTEHGEIAFQEAVAELQARGVLPGGRPVQSAPVAQPAGQYLTPEGGQELFGKMLRDARAAGASLSRQLSNTRKSLGAAFMDAPVLVGNQQMRRGDWLAAKAEATGQTPEEILLRNDQRSLMTRLGQIAYDQRVEEMRRRGGVPGVGRGGGPPGASVPSGDVLPAGYHHDARLDEGPDQPIAAPGFDD